MKKIFLFIIPLILFMTSCASMEKTDHWVDLRHQTEYIINGSSPNNGCINFYATSDNEYLLFTEYGSELETKIVEGIGDRTVAGLKLFNKSCSRVIETYFESEIPVNELNPIWISEFPYIPLEFFIQFPGEVEVYALVEIFDSDSYSEYEEFLICTWSKAQMAKLKRVWNEELANFQ